MTIERLFEIIKCKKSKHCVTLRAAYSTLNLQEQIKDLQLRIKLYDQYMTIVLLLSSLLLKLQEIITIDKYVVREDVATPSVVNEPIPSVKYVSFL